MPSMSEAESLVDYAIHVIIDADLRTQYAEKSAAYWRRRYRTVCRLSAPLVLMALAIGIAIGHSIWGAR